MNSSENQTLNLIFRTVEDKYIDTVEELVKVITEGDKQLEKMSNELHFTANKIQELNDIFEYKTELLIRFTTQLKQAKQLAILKQQKGNEHGRVQEVGQGTNEQQQSTTGGSSSES
jgi:hypothetical protein